ncbi:MAG: FkbM family methyltransferase [Acidobacteriota bacterium]|nr:FkbM family methyltransferase [Acidobacteriota bacterium]
MDCRLGPAGSWLGTYERHVQRLFCERVRPGDVVFDIGANAGFFTLLASSLVGPAGHVYAFEPLPRNLYYLERHVRLNDVTNTTIQSLAIASTTGAARFRSGPNASMGKLSDGGELHVLTASLDDLIANSIVRTPAFIKMDIEGAESDALSGASGLLAGTGLTIVLSTHGHKQHEQCWSVLQNAQFDLDLIRDGTADGDYLILGTK